MTISDKDWSGFEQKLRSYVARRVEAGYVDDLVGEILLRLVRREPDWQAAKSPVAWMYRVATNVVTDHYRRHAVEHRIVENRDLSDLSDATEDEGDITPRKELAQCLIPLIEDLPPRYREALQLVDIKELPQAQAAAQLGLSLSGMKSRVQRGRLKLKGLLLDCCTIEINRRGNVVNYSGSSACC
ncbi:MAG: sigma-70 family RNA polymerase sigma factor [Porticoccaceae bacterium]|nr:sigma-70 family RNA polymerase sigma factor [Porticoccaceae bacterium]